MSSGSESQSKPKSWREMFAENPQNTFEQLLNRDIGRGSVKFDKQGAILEAEFEGLQRLAKMYASSTVVPTDFQGGTEKAIANCFIVLQLAQRLNLNPYILFQNVYIVHGKPGFAGKFLAALLNASPLTVGRVQYRRVGKAGTDSYGMQAIVTDAETGEEVAGPPVTWEVVKAEGWNKDKGTQKSKWATMSELMFHYRSAAWLVSTHYPELTMGTRTVDELLDMDAAGVFDGEAGEVEEPQTERTLDDVRQQLAEPRQRTRQDDSPHEPVERGQLFDEAGLPEIATS